MNLIFIVASRFYLLNMVICSRFIILQGNILFVLQQRITAYCKSGNYSSASRHSNNLVVSSSFYSKKSLSYVSNIGIYG